MDINVRTSDDICIIDLKGRIDDASATNVKNNFDRELESGKIKFILNMKKVDFINPNALQMVKEFIKKTRENGGEFKLCDVQPAVQKIFDYTGFTDQTVFSHNEKQAVKDLKAIKKKKVVAPVEEVEEYGATIQMGGSLADLQKKAAPPEVEEYGATIQMGGSLADLQKKAAPPPPPPQDDDGYGATIQMSGSLADLQKKKKDQDKN